MPHYKVGKGKHYCAYLKETLRVMFEAGIDCFNTGEVASWAGLRPQASMHTYLENEVQLGHLSIEPKEVYTELTSRTYRFRSVYWFYEVRK